ncbi:MAG: hypothetical protein ACYCWW_05910 [Deltaproteobacteria bacterium]
MGDIRPALNGVALAVTVTPAEDLRWSASGAKAESWSTAEPSNVGAVVRAATAHAVFPKGALLHSAGIVIEGRAVLCVAPSGGGKSTLSRRAADRAPVLSDETVCVRWNEPGEPLLYGSRFWSGDPLPSLAGGHPLAAICFLRKGPPELRPLGKARAFRELMAETHIPDRPEGFTTIGGFIAGLIERLPCWELSFSLDPAEDPLALVRRASMPSGTPR